MFSKINIVTVKNVLWHIEEDIMPLATELELNIEIYSCIDKGGQMIQLMKWHKIQQSIVW